MYDDSKSPASNLRLKDFLLRVGIAKSTYYDWADPRSKRYDPSMPKRYKLRAGGKAVGLNPEEADQWLKSRRATGGTQ